MAERDKSYYRYQRNRAINKKLNIVKNTYSEDAICEMGKKKGKLSKGKVHCSCPLCSQKTKESLKASDVRKYKRDKTKIDEFFNENYY